MRTDRLLKLADFLDELPSERFDFSEWTGYDFGGHQDLSCGTTACAMGWACTIFDELTLKQDPIGIGIPYYGDHSGFYAASEFFEIDIWDTRYLFDPHNSKLGDNATAKQVAQHIREFCDE